MQRGVVVIKDRAEHPVLEVGLRTSNASAQWRDRIGSISTLRVGARTFLTFDVPTTLGGTTYLPGQILTWNGTSFATVVLDPAWPISSRLNAMGLGRCVDADGDGAGSPGDFACPRGVAIDCNDADMLSWAAPGEVTGLMHGGASLSWIPPADAGGSPSLVLYDVIRSANASDYVSAPPATCVESDDGADTMAVDPDIPAPGTGFYYLVRAQNACPGASGVGSLGTTSGGVPRTARVCP